MTAQTIRVGSASMLREPKMEKYTAREKYVSNYNLGSVCVPNERPDQIIEELETIDDPLYDLVIAISELEENMARTIMAASNEYEALCETTRTKVLDDDTSDEGIGSSQKAPNKSCQ